MSGDRASAIDRSRNRAFVEAPLTERDRRQVGGSGSEFGRHGPIALSIHPVAGRAVTQIHLATLGRGAQLASARGGEREERQSDDGGTARP
jgi:hypothetical protein